MKIEGIKKLKNLNHEIWLVFILVFAFALRLNFFIGLNLNDDLTYVNTAHDIIRGKFNFNAWIFAVRHMMNFPIAFFFFILGISDFSAALWPLLTSIGSIVIAYYIGKKIFDVKVGLLSAFLLSIFPVDVAYATTIVPDIPVAFFMGLSVYLFLLGEKGKNTMYYFLSGTAIGLAWLVKSLALLILPFFVAYFILDKVGLGLKTTRRKVSPKEYKSVQCLAAVVIILFLLSLIYAFYTGRTTKPTSSLLEVINPPIVENGTELYEKGIAKLYAFRTDKDIYWDVESNLYTNKASRGYNKIKEDLEYSLHNDRVIHALREDIKLLAEVDEPYESVDCFNENYALSYVSIDIDYVFCLKTIEENYVKLKIIDFDDESVTITYQIQVS